jgi:hypothetical protein
MIVPFLPIQKGQMDAAGFAFKRANGDGGRSSGETAAPGVPAVIAL